MTITEQTDELTAEIAERIRNASCRDYSEELLAKIAEGCAADISDLREFTHSEAMPSRPTSSMASTSTRAGRLSMRCRFRELLKVSTVRLTRHEDHHAVDTIVDANTRVQFVAGELNDKPITDVLYGER